MTPPPSPLTYPLAEASKVLQRPSLLNIFDCETAMVLSGNNWRFTPPTTACRHSPFRKLLHARCKPTNEDEQAVSMAIQGPLNPNTYAILPGIALNTSPWLY